ncbi:hypothetical protein P8C59_001163 [Phyllachora maydis]|uniref:N-glycosylation protein EOS1 n=1 Tax=Phyllachora maydis TaxID=1825666 RepID=A0AAD9HYR8_9PEZI|nr:hypothetical protein P8C59_001163 [Phyllachora maydis]
MPAHRAHVRQRQKSEVQGVVAGLLPPSDNEPEVTARSTLLQPRVAVVLGVPPRWHQPLFICRLFSTAPAMWWGLPNAIRFLVQLRLLVGLGTGAGASGVVEDSLAADEEGLHWVRAIARGSAVTPNLLEARLRLSETALAILWCGASAYLSFFFTDCLMSRWLLNYAPQATIIRLLTVDALNWYLTSRVLDLLGGFANPRMILPAWIAIATTLTALYHVTYRKINIRKETSISVSVFSIASFISMMAMLLLLHSARTTAGDVPIIMYTINFWTRLETFAFKVLEWYVNCGGIK